MKIFSKNISKEQCKDTGLAMVLILLLLGFFLDNTLYFKISVVVLVINMITPGFYKPIAVLWFGLSHVLGVIMSKIVLTIIFFFLVTPVSAIRKMLGYDSLKLRQFKNSNESVFKVRNIIFTRNEMETPY